VGVESIAVQGGKWPVDGRRCEFIIELFHPDHPYLLDTGNRERPAQELNQETRKKVYFFYPFFEKRQRMM
jgi:hypothetical protein